MGFLILAIVLIVSSECASEVPVSVQPQTSEESIRFTGFRAATETSAWAWNEGAEAFRLWHISAERRDVFHLTIEQVPIPSELDRFERHKDQGDIDPHVKFYAFDDHSIALFWIDSNCTEIEAGQKKFSCYRLYTERTSDSGRHWTRSRATLVSNPSMAYVRLLTANDEQKIWAVLSSEAGAGQMPESLVTTDDGGRTWKVLVDGSHKGNLSIGENGDQLLVAKSRSELWFAAIRYSDFPDDLAFSRSTDGGMTWTGYSGFSRELSVRSSCQISSLVAFYSGNGQSISDLILEVHLDSCCREERCAYAALRYNSVDNGVTWSPPFPITFSWNERNVPYRIADLHFANTEVGWLTVCLERNGKCTYQTFETLNAGSTWQTLSYDLAHSFGSDSKQKIEAVQAKGQSVWMLLGRTGTDRASKLLYSPNNARNWYDTGDVVTNKPYAAPEHR